MRQDKAMAAVVALEDFFVELMPVLRRFPKQERYALGSFMETTILEAVSYLHHYIYSEKDSEILRRAKGRIHLLLFHARVAKRMGYFSEGQYEIFSHRLVQVGRPLVIRKKNDSI